MEQETNVVMTQEQPTKAQEILASKPVETVETPVVEGTEQPKVEKTQDFCGQ